MPMTQGKITQAGAVIDVLVGIGPRRQRLLEKHSMHVPAPVPVKAVIDTGASISGFSCHIFASLELQPIGTILVLTPSTPADAPHEFELFDVTIHLVANARSYPVLNSHVIGADGWRPASEEGVEGLIGRDILNQATFNYYGQDRAFSFGFPDHNPTEW